MTKSTANATMSGATSQCGVHFADEGEGEDTALGQTGSSRHISGKVPYWHQVCFRADSYESVRNFFRPLHMRL
jgi:hypothetical protein